jgi:xylulokinase
MLPWFVPEITPHVEHAGVHRLNFDAAGVEQNVRAVVEGQALAMRLHSRWITDRATTIRATGGAAANDDLLQVIADVFNADVVRLETANAAALGAALRAYHAERRTAGEPVSWEDVVAGFTDPALGPPVRPSAERNRIYEKLLPEYERFEAQNLT